MYGNISIQVKNSNDKNEKLVKSLGLNNILNQFKLNYIEPSKKDVLDLLNYTNEYKDEERILLGEKYDDFEKYFFQIYYNNNEFNRFKNDKLVQDVSKIKSICNYFILKYKIKINAARPFQLANKYNIKLYPVSLPTTRTPSFPSGHAGLSYALYIYFIKIDFKNKMLYYNLYNNIQLSRIIAGVHFQQDNDSAVELIDEIFKNLR